MFEYHNDNRSVSPEISEHDDLDKMNMGHFVKSNKRRFDKSHQHNQRNYDQGLEKESSRQNEMEIDVDEETEKVGVDNKGGS